MFNLLTFIEEANIQIKVFKGQQDSLQSFCYTPALKNKQKNKTQNKTKNPFQNQPLIMAFRKIPTGQESVLAVNSPTVETSW